MTYIHTDQFRCAIIREEARIRQFIALLYFCYFQDMSLLLKKNFRIRFNQVAIS